MSIKVGKNQNTFIVKFSELDERLDPAFYKPEYSDILNSRDEWFKAKDISISIHHPPEYERVYSEKGVQLIRSQNVRPTGLSLSERPVYFSGDFLKNKRIVFPKRGDILIVRSGVNAGDVTVIEEDLGNAIIGADNLLLKPNRSVIPKFVQVYFFTEIGRKLLNRYLTGATNKHISPYYLSKVPIPKIPFDDQKECIKLFEAGLNSKYQKEQQAQNFLDSIDSYLLRELGITLPERYSGLANRIFRTSFSKITGGRFDPKLYDKNTEQLRDAIKNSHFLTIPLKELITQSFSGDWGEDEKEELGDSYTRCLVIRATEFDNLYNLNLCNSRVKYRLIHKIKLSKIDIQENDLLIEKSGGSPDQPVGRISIITKEVLKYSPICYSNFIHKIRVNHSLVVPDYLFCFLKTVHNIKLTDAMQSQTSGIRNLIMTNYFNQKIPLPKTSKQIEIAKNISVKRNSAKQLQQESTLELEKAKKEIEKIILG